LNCGCPVTPIEKKLGFWEKAAQERKDEKERIAKMDREGIAYCLKCKSTSLSAHKKGFGAGKAAIGGILLGPIGLVAGGIRSQKVKVTCLKCGYQFKAGKK